MTERRSTSGGVASRAGAGLERVRTDVRAHALAVVVAVAVGLAAAWVHWSGLIVGGALVGLTARTLPRAVAGGFAFGVVVLVAFVASLGDSTWRALEMAPIAYVTVAAALGLPVLGSLVRGLG